MFQPIKSNWMVMSYQLPLKFLPPVEFWILIGFTTDLIMEGVFHVRDKGITFPTSSGQESL